MENRLLGTYFPTYFINFTFFLPQYNFKYWIVPLFKVGIYFLKCNLQTFQKHNFANKISQHFQENDCFFIIRLGHGSVKDLAPGRAWLCGAWGRPLVALVA